MSSRTIRALLLDFDGTILDTESVEFRIWAELYQQYGLELPLSLWADSIGRGANDIKFDPFAYLQAQITVPLNEAEVHAERRERFRELIQVEPVRPGITEYINDARASHLLLGVASSSRHDWVDGHLQRLGLFSFFDCIHCADDVTFAKPDPELYLLTCSTLGIRPDEAVTLEDSPNGLWAARRAGVFAVGFPNPLTAQLDLSHADLIVPSLSEMPLASLLQQIP